jgi:hypothetical protein
VCWVRGEAAPRGPGRPRRAHCVQLSRVRDHAVIQVLSSRLCALCTVSLRCLTAIHLLLYVRGIWEGEVPIAAKGSAERVGTLLDDLMQGNGSLIMTPNSWPLRATAVEREHVVNAKTLDPAAEQPRRRGKPKVRFDCKARIEEGSLQGRLESEPVSSTDRDRGRRVRG